MATAISVHFVGGPCGGQTKDVPALVASAGLIICSGAYYQVQPGGGSPLEARYIVPPPAPETPGARSVSAYRDLQTAIESTLPNQLGKAARITRAALQRLPTHGKVG